MTKDEALAVAQSGTDEVRPLRDVRSQGARVSDPRRSCPAGCRRTRTVDGRTVDDDWQFTKIYVRPQGKWVVAAFHASPAP